MTNNATPGREHEAVQHGDKDLSRLAHHDVLESVAGIKRGDHVCAIYEYTPSEHLDAVVTYLKEGLALGEQCIYLSDDSPLPLFVQQLKDAGIDVAREQERGSLQVWTREPWRQPGPLDSIRKAAQVREIMDAAFAAGFVGVRFAVEMTWTLAPDVPVESVEHWEATSNDILDSGVPVTAMCLYGRRRLTPDRVSAGLRTHPLVIDGTGLHTNRHYKKT